MGSRHGKVARTPTSRRDPQALAGGATRPSPAVAVSAGRAGVNRAEVVRLAEALLDQPTYEVRWRHGLSLTRTLDWLETFPAEDWQDRWLLSGADEAGSQWWGPPDLTTAQRQRISVGVGILVVLQVIRPSYAWLFASRATGAYASFRGHNQTEAFAQLELQTSQRGLSARYATDVLNLLTRVVIVTGKNLAELDLADFNDYTVAGRAHGRRSEPLQMAYACLQATGGLQGLPSTLRQARTRGQLSVAELVDYYPIVNQDVRDVLVHYLVERSAMLDYGSLVRHVQILAGRFWVDLERHHPGICSLHLPDPVVQAWKQRLRTLPDGRPRRTACTVLFAVRALYLDLQQWALDDPARWAQWAVPCPINEADIRGHVKETRRRQARMQQRTRTLIPVLPNLVAAAEQHLDWSTRLLAAVRAVGPGQTFIVDEQSYRRTGRETKYFHPTALSAAPLDRPGPRFDVERLEDNAFWVFAAIEVLRRTGARLEELLELTHLSLRQYQAPTGELIPLIQISPSKTDTERVIPADPDLVAVRRASCAASRTPTIRCRCSAASTPTNGLSGHPFHTCSRPPPNTNTRSSHRAGSETCWPIWPLEPTSSTLTAHH